MLKTRDTQLLQKFMHAMRGELTLYNFATSEEDRALVVDSMSRLLERTERYVLATEGAPKFDDIELSHVITSIVEQIASKRLHFDAKDARVHGNSMLLSSMVAEVLENALRYSNDDVHVSLHTANNRCVIRIEDLGDGLTAHAVEQIAEPFVPTDTEQSGHGLGLAIAWAVVQLHDGAMTVHTDTGQGTTVLITLDLV